MHLISLPQKLAYLSGYGIWSYGQQRLDDVRCKTVFDEQLVSVECAKVKKQGQSQVLAVLRACEAVHEHPAHKIVHRTGHSFEPPARLGAVASSRSLDISRRAAIKNIFLSMHGKG